MNYKDFCSRYLSEDVFIQPRFENKHRIIAYAFNQRTGKMIAIWVPRLGVVWKKK